MESWPRRAGGKYRAERKKVKAVTTWNIKYSFLSFPFITNSNLKNVVSSYYYFHFRDGVTKAQKMKAPGSVFHGQKIAELVNVTPDITQIILRAHQYVLSVCFLKLLLLLVSKRLFNKIG